jgi:hypothetical protein
MRKCTQITIIRERREFIQSKEKETRRIILYIQVDMHKRSIDREENRRRNTTSLFCIITEISKFLSCRHSAFDFFCRRFDCRHLYLPTFALSTFRHIILGLDHTASSSTVRVHLLCSLAFLASFFMFLRHLHS